jgi:monofunctional biosynthetic peptidoglycan transglycosylase
VEPPPPPPPPSPPPSPSPSPPPPPGIPSRRWSGPWPRRAADAAVLVAALAALALRCSVPDPAPLASENPISTAFIDLRRADAAAAGKPFTLRWQWRPLAQISRYLRAAVIGAEDYNFYRHDGVDWHALEHAVSADWNKGAMSIGGSTITQQLAKNLYLSPRRSLIRKVRELLIAFSLEDHLGKQRILELYLNVVEWGDGVFGAEAAARAWFHHSAQALSPAEAVRLAVALPNPITRAPNVRDPELTRKAVRLIRVLRMEGLLGAAQERTALDEVGAPDERVLPDREVTAGAPAAPGAPATDAPSASAPATSSPAATSPETAAPEGTTSPRPPVATPPGAAAPGGVAPSGTPAGPSNEPPTPPGGAAIPPATTEPASESPTRPASTPSPPAPHVEPEPSGAPGPSPPDPSASSH